jgi:putative transposase
LRLYGKINSENILVLVCLAKLKYFMDKFNRTYRIPSARFENWDYASHGLYFITICTKNREHFFGEILPVETQNFASPNVVEIQKTHNYASLQESTMGKIAREYWLQIPVHFPFVELDEFVVMPDHIHGIIFINKPEYSEWQPNKFGPQSKNLSSILRGYKAAVQKFATMNSIEFSWQARYYDHVVRSQKDLNNIRQYIHENPYKWLCEKSHSPNQAKAASSVLKVLNLK